MQRHNPFLPNRPRYIQPQARSGCSLILAAVFGALIGGAAMWSALVGPDSTPPGPAPRIVTVKPNFGSSR